VRLLADHTWEVLEERGRGLGSPEATASPDGAEH
jgi:hypothetical protein